MTITEEPKAPNLFAAIAGASVDGSEVVQLDKLADPPPSTEAPSPSSSIALSPATARISVFSSPSPRVLGFDEEEAAGGVVLRGDSLGSSPGPRVDLAVQPPWVAEGRLQKLLKDLGARRRRIYRLDDLQALAHEADHTRFALRNHIVILEASLQDARCHANAWRQRYLEKERAYQNLYSAERHTKQELQAMVDIAEQLEKDVKQLRQDVVDAETRAENSDAKARAYLREVKLKSAGFASKCEDFASISDQLQSYAMDAARLRRSGEMAELDYKEQLQRERASHAHAASLAQERQEALEAHISDLVASLSDAVRRAEAAECERKVLKQEKINVEQDCQALTLQVHQASERGARLGVEPIYVGTADYNLPIGDHGSVPPRPPPRPPNFVYARSPKEARRLAQRA